MKQRKCMLCKDVAIYVDDTSELVEYINEDGTFKLCTYSDAWEICSEVGDPEKIPNNVSFLIKNNEYVGRIRSLD